MKKVFLCCSLFILFLNSNAQQNIGIGTVTPHSSAVLDITSADKGLLIPRLTLAQRPTSPALGLVYFQTDGAVGFYYFNGSIWKYINTDVITGTAGQIPVYNSSNSIAGTNSFVWDNTNSRLGIGTSSPSYALELNSSNYIVSSLRSSHGAGSGINLNSIGNANYTILATGSAAGAGVGKLGFYDETTGTYRMVIDGSGNLGLGVTNPSTKLEVSGAGGLKISTTNTGTGTTDWIAGNFGGTSGNRVVIGLNNGNATIGAHNSTLSSWANLLLNPGGGNVGIGTTSPATGLHVKSATSGAILSLEGSTGVTESYIQFYPNSYASGRKAWLGFGTGGTDFRITNENNGHIILAPGSGASVGVGNTNPQQMLDVTGTIRSSALAGTGNRMVIANTNGDLTTQTIPTSDNLGNHIATQNINLATNKLVGNGGTNGIAIANDGTVTVNTLASGLNRMVVADASGNLQIYPMPTGDNFGNHIALQNISLNNNWLSNNGAASGLRIDNDGNVGINLAAPQGVLDVPYYVSGSPVSGGLTVKQNGNVGIGTNSPTANLDVVGTVRLRNGAGDNKILKSDANGNATWTTPAPLMSYSVNTPIIPPTSYPSISYPGGSSTPTIGTATLDWTHNLGYQPIIMCNIEQISASNAEFIKVAYQHLNSNTIRFKFSNTAASNASGILKIILMN